MKNSIIQKDESRCYLTGSTLHLDKHHCMNGAFRKKAEQDGLFVYLNHEVHMYLHNTGEGRQKMNELKVIAQKKYEENHTHEEWMERYKKNYV